jgi:hypothetical protein
LPGGVMFAAISNSSIAAEKDITFSESISNVGQGFDVSRGVFTAPVTGTFEFSFSSMTGSIAISYARVYVRKNGNVMLRFMDKNDSDRLNNFGHVWQLILQKGDEINLQLYDGTIYADPNYSTSFIGHLVAE